MLTIHNTNPPFHNRRSFRQTRLCFATYRVGNHRCDFKTTPDDAKAVQTRPDFTNPRGEVRQNQARARSLPRNAQILRIRRRRRRSASESPHQPAGGEKARKTAETLLRAADDQRAAKSQGNRERPVLGLRLAADHRWPGRRVRPDCGEEDECGYAEEA